MTVLKNALYPVEITLTVNGRQITEQIPPYMTLVELLRERLFLTGVKEGCEDANCGACTVLLDRKPVKSCSMLAAQADGKSILTIEGLADLDNGLHPLQQAFIDYFALQCGFCTPAMILTALALLEENPQASEAEIREALHGNLCRCTGYTKIVEAIMAVRDGVYRQEEEKHAI